MVIRTRIVVRRAWLVDLSYRADQRLRRNPPSEEGLTMCRQ